MTTRKGSSTANEIYQSVGIALSFWESSEDVLMGLFKRLCAKIEPTAFETYVSAPRAVRMKMLESALKSYKSRFTSAELDTVRSAMKALDKLSSVRNQIAHGHCTNTTKKVNDVVVMQGHFLVPSFNEKGYQIQRDFRFAHTAAEIDEWRDKVRTERAKIMDIDHACAIREQDAEQRDNVIRRTQHLAESIASRQVSAAKFVIVPREPKVPSSD